MRRTSRPLKLSDLEALAARVAVEPQPALLYATVDALASSCQSGLLPKAPTRLPVPPAASRYQPTA